MGINWGCRTRVGQVNFSSPAVAAQQTSDGLLLWNKVGFEPSEETARYELQRFQLLFFFFSFFSVAHIQRQTPAFSQVKGKKIKNPSQFNVVSDNPFPGCTMKYARALALWISEQTFDVSSFWTKFNKHNKDEGSRSNFSFLSFLFFFFFLSPLLPATPYAALPLHHRDPFKCPKANIISHRWRAFSAPAIMALSSGGIH